MSEQVKKTEKKAQEQTRFNKIVTTIDKAIDEAMTNGQWVSVDLVAIDGYRLTINISPRGVPALTLVSPSLRNRFVIKDEETIKIVMELFNTFINDKELKEAVFAGLSAHGWGQKTTKGRIYKI